MFHLKGAPSSVRNEPRKRFVQECGSSPVRECASKMLRPGPFAAQANERWLLRCSAHVGLPLRCRGALGDAVLRSFGCWMSPLMRWRRSGWSMSGCRYRCRCGRGCRCCPRRCRVLAGDSDYRVPKGVDVLGHCVKRGVGERLGNHVNQGFGGRYRHGAPGVASVGGSDAYRAEAEPFTAKRSGTG